MFTSVILLPRTENIDTYDCYLNVNLLSRKYLQYTIFYYDNPSSIIIFSLKLRYTMRRNYVS